MARSLSRRTHFLLFHHTFTLLRGRVLRWRLETYGLYAPSYPQERPWWRINMHALRLLFRHRYAYRDWLEEMAAVRAGGATGWWQAHLGSRHTTLQAYIQHENRPDP